MFFFIIYYYYYYYFFFFFYVGVSKDAEGGKMKKRNSNYFYFLFPFCESACACVSTYVNVCVCVCVCVSKKGRDNRVVHQKRAETPLIECFVAATVGFLRFVRPSLYSFFLFCFGFFLSLYSFFLFFLLAQYICGVHHCFFLAYVTIIYKYIYVYIYIFRKGSGCTWC